jgi:hypothetical protein
MLIDEFSALVIVDQETIGCHQLLDLLPIFENLNALFYVHVQFSRRSALAVFMIGSTEHILIVEKSARRMAFVADRHSRIR